MDTQFLFRGSIQEPLPIEIVWALTFCFFLSFTSFLIVIFLAHHKRFKQNKTKTLSVEEIRFHITNFLFRNYSLYSVDTLKSIIKKSKEHNQTIIEILFKIKQTLNDLPTLRLEYLYKELSLSQVSAKKLNDKNWAIQIEGIKELVGMDDQTYISEIELLVNNPHHLVRIEAFFAMLKLKGTEGLTLLEILEYPISDWQQMQIIKILKERVNVKLPDFSQWFYLANISVACFAIRLTAIFNQTHLINKIVGLLSINEHPLRIQAAIEVLIYLKIPTFTDQIKALSTTNNKEVQLSILYFFEEFGTLKDIIFLRDFLYDNYLWTDDELFLLGLRVIKKVFNDDSRFFNFAGLYFSNQQAMILQVMEESK